jgi:hypothetical protein
MKIKKNTDISGEILLLQYIVGMVNADNPVLHLFANDVTPSDSTVLGDLTEVAGATGYSAITLVSSNWTTTQAGGVTTAIHSVRTFTFTTDATSYGYYITNESGNLLWLERFSGAPFSIPNGGGTVSITSRLTLS